MNSHEIAGRHAAADEFQGLFLGQGPETRAFSTARTSRPHANGSDSLVPRPLSTEMCSNGSGDPARNPLCCGTMVKSFCPRKRISFAVVLSATLLWSALAGAEINVDDTLTGTAHGLFGPDYVLNPTSGRGEGPNLYYSFGRLVVSPGQTLTITVPPGVERIFFRITGRGGFTDGFDIGGEVTVSSSPVDLIVLSALPIEIGELASLGFDGILSLIAGDSVDLDAGGSFPLATTPAEFGRGAPTQYIFDGDNATVTVSAGTLNRSSSDILLAGGTVRLEERATVGVDDGGRLGLAAVGAGGLLSWSDSELVVSTLGGRVEVLGGSTLSIGRGRLAIAGDTLDLTDSTVTQSDTSPDGVLQLAGNVIGIAGPEISLTGSDTPQLRIEGSSVEISSGTIDGVSTGRSGGLSIEAATISLRDTTFDFTSGDAVAEKLMLTATGLADLLSTTLRNQSTADGAVEAINVTGEQVRLADSQIDLSSTSGSAAGVLLQAVDRLDLTEGSVVSVSTSAESTGSVRALAGNVIGITGGELSIDTGSAVDGDGDLLLEAPQVLLSGARLGMIARSGDRGRIEITSDGLDIADGTVFAMCSDNPVRSGHLNAEASVSITFRGVDNATTISTCNLSTGDAGVVSLGSPTILYEHDLSLDLEAPNGEDGFVRTGGDDTLLVAVDDQETTPECSVRRGSVRSGIDDGVPGGIEADGVLQDDEVDEVDTLCVSLERAEELLYRISDLPPTDECPDGAQLVEYGPDKDDDGLVDDEEVVGEFVVCRSSNEENSGGDAEVEGDDGSAQADGGDSRGGNNLDSTSDGSCNCRHTATLAHPRMGLALVLIVFLARRRRGRSPRA